MTDYTPVTDHAARLRHLAIDLEDLVCLDVSEEACQLRTAADHIEELEKENRVLRRLLGTQWRDWDEVARIDAKGGAS